MNTITKSLGLVGLVLSVMLLTAEPLTAQPPGRGGRGGSSDRGGPGGMRGGPGGMRGGPGGMRGGPGGPGGMRGSYGGMPGGSGGGPSSFIARMDTNGNGLLDPDETQGRARMFLERTGLDLSRPVPLERVNRAFEDMRNQRMQEMGGGDPRSRGDDRGRDRGDDRGRSSSSRSSSASPDYEPLVPGFGEPDLFDPVPGFGDMGERFAVKIEEVDRQEAQRTMGRNDTNRNGVLDAEEISRGRWSTDALSTDRNRDGKLTLTELALRYAMRRVEREGGSSSSRPSSRSSSRDSSSSRSSSSRDDSRENRMVEMMFGRYDRNRDGKISREEWSGFRPEYDANKDGQITKEEFSKAMASRFGGDRGRGGERGSDGGRFYSRRDSGGEGEKSGESSSRSTSSVSSRNSYRLKRPAERLAEYEDLPPWFSQTDANEDGQVKMSEYATSWSDSVVADFSQFDLNGDGIITAPECLKASEYGAVQGSPSGGSSYTASDSSYRRSSRSQRDRERDEDEPESSATVASTEPAGEESNPASDKSDESSKAEAVPTNVGNVPKVYVTYAVNLIKKYDKNKDGKLTKDEWGSMNKDYSYADADKDGQLVPHELGAAFMKK